MIRIRWKQHPVGHGGFHIGMLDASDGKTFTWGFDCGSRRTAKFNEYLKATYTHCSRPMDWLFISHFDTDHVSGLDELLLLTEVENVMVPYLENHELVLLLLNEIDRGSFNRALVELTADSATYFLSRGVNRVVFLGDRGEAAEPEPIRTPPDRPEDGRGWSFTMEPFPRAGKIPKWSSRPPGASPVEIINSNSCDLVLGGMGGGLRLKPYRAPIKDAAHTDLVTEVERLVGTKVGELHRSGIGKLAYKIAHYARTTRGRGELRDIYSRHAGSSNRSSLSLLSAPIVSGGGNSAWSFYHPERQQWGTGAVGWMNTGDAELLSASDLDDWKKCYATYLADVAALAIPHHGSDKNSGKAMQDLCLTASLLVHVSAKLGKHPGANVTLAGYDRLCRVTEVRDTAAIMTFESW